MSNAILIGVLACGVALILLVSLKGRGGRTKG
jgi:hypothetical protein